MMNNKRTGICSLQITAIQVDASLQPRVDGLDAGHVDELQAMPDIWLPLVLVEQNGKHVLVDGFHRFAAAQNLGMESVPVKIVDAPADGDLHGLAFRLNSQHGKPLTLTDKRTEAERLLRRDPTVSNMEVARSTVLSPTTVAAIRESLERSNAIEQKPIRSCADGRSYTVSPSEKRQPGELPEPGILENTADAVTGVFTSAQRTQQRRITQYFQRLTTALEDGNKLDGWETAEDAAQACVLVLGQERAKTLAERIGCNCQDVLDVAALLGYREDV